MLLNALSWGNRVCGVSGGERSRRRMGRPECILGGLHGVGDQEINSHRRGSDGAAAQSDGSGGTVDTPGVLGWSSPLVESTEHQINQCPAASRRGSTGPTQQASVSNITQPPATQQTLTTTAATLPIIAAPMVQITSYTMPNLLYFSWRQERKDDASLKLWALLEVCSLMQEGVYPTEAQV